jgi:hypothetical protein
MIGDFSRFDDWKASLLESRFLAFHFPENL